MPINQIAPKRLADTIVEQLETMILEGTLEPGQRLPPERVLAKTYSKTVRTLRKSLSELENKGML